MTDEVLDHLAHYGVKGMQWGIRRREGPDGRVTGSSRKKKNQKKVSVDARTTGDLRKRPVKSLTNMQLKKVNERLNLESKFSQMNPTRVDKGRAAVNSAMKVTTGAVGAAALRELATNPKYKNGVITGYKAVSGRVGQEILRRESLIRQVGRGKFG